MEFLSITWIPSYRRGNLNRGHAFIFYYGSTLAAPFSQLSFILMYLTPFLLAPISTPAKYIFGYSGQFLIFIVLFFFLADAFSLFCAHWGVQRGMWKISISGFLKLYAKLNCWQKNIPIYKIIQQKKLLDSPLPSLPCPLLPCFWK